MDDLTIKIVSRISGKEESHSFSSEREMERFLENQINLENEYTRCSEDEDARSFQE